MIQRFESHAAGKSRIADNGYDLTIVFIKTAGHNKTKSRRNGCGAMAAGKYIIFGAFVLIRKTAQASELPQCRKIFCPACEDLVRIRLMADIPYNVVARRVERVMYRYRQLHRAKSRRKMPPGLRYCRQYLLPYLFCKYRQIDKS